MNPSTQLQRTDGIFTAPVDHELVLMSPALDGYLAMDDVGRRIWEILEAPLALEDLCQRLAEEYTATPSQIAEDVVPFLSRLEEKGLIRAVAG